MQGEIIAAAIAASATVDSDVIQVDPDRLLQLKSGGAVSPFSFYDPSLEFPINPERVAPLLGNLVTPTRTRARIYDQSGFMILDSASIYQRGGVIRRQHLPPIHHKAPVDEHLVSRSIGGDADQATQRIVGWHYSGVLQIHRHKVGFRA